MLFQLEKNIEMKVVIKIVCIPEMITLVGKTTQVFRVSHLDTKCGI